MAWFLHDRDLRHERVKYLSGNLEFAHVAGIQK